MILNLNEIWLGYGLKLQMNDLEHEWLKHELN